ncbi:MAG: AzlD domain-containing protein [Ruminococcaceae bacterium]|nr:AzlD domain-containing protein [Oscillospiraceae bacterium]
MKFDAFLPYLLVMAAVTYLVRAVPLVLIKKKIQNKFILSFLYYMPYAVLSVMTVPAVFFATGSVVTAVAGVTVALLLAYFKQSLLTVAAGASLAVFAAEMLMRYLS